jgi:hypothetical protein
MGQWFGKVLYRRIYRRSFPIWCPECPKCPTCDLDPQGEDKKLDVGATGGREFTERGLAANGRENSL